MAANTKQQEQYHLTLLFSGSILTRMMIVDPDGVEASVSVLSDAKQVRTQIPWDRGTQAVVLGFLHYKIMGGIDISEHKFVSLAGRCPESSAYYTRQKPPWNSVNVIKPSSVYEFATRIGAVFSTKDRDDKKHIGVAFDATLLPTKNIYVLSDSRPLEPNALFALYDAIYEEWRGGRDVGSSAASVENVRPTGSLPSHTTVSSAQRTSKTNTWFMAEAVRSSSPKAIGEWAWKEIATLLSHFLNQGPRYHPSFSIDEAAILRGEDAKAFSKPDPVQAVMNIELAHQLTGPLPQTVIAPFLDWASKEAIRGMDPKTAIPVRNAAALASVLCRSNVAADAQQWFRENLLMRGHGFVQIDWYENWKARGSDLVGRVFLLDYLGIYAQRFCPPEDDRDGDVTDSDYERSWNMILTELSSKAVLTGNAAVDDYWGMAIVLSRLVTQSDIYRATDAPEPRSLEPLLSNIASSWSRSSLAGEFFYSPLGLKAADMPTRTAFRLECRLATTVRALRSRLPLATAHARTLETARSLAKLEQRYAAYLKTWEIRSRSLCNEETLKPNDVNTLAYLLKSLGTPDELRHYIGG